MCRPTYNRAFLCPLAVAKCYAVLFPEQGTQLGTLGIPLYQSLDVVLSKRCAKFGALVILSAERGAQ